MNPENNNPSTATGTTPPPVTPTPTPVKSKFDTQNIKDMGMKLFDKFYANKKIFWPVTVFFVIVFLIVVLGLLFGKKKPTEPVVTDRPSPSVFIAPRPTFPPMEGMLGEAAEKLSTLRDFIENMDVRQGRLTPPKLNYEIKF